MNCDHSTIVRHLHSMDKVQKSGVCVPHALSQGFSTFWVRGSIYIFHIILRAAVIADYKIIMDILNIIRGAWAARQVTWVKQRKGCRTSCDVGKAAEGLENELWRRWSDEGLENEAEPLEPLRRFTYVTAHSSTLPPLYLRHSSFYNPSVASPMS